MMFSMKSYPMIGVLVVVMAALVALDRFYPSFLLYETEWDAIDSLRPYAFVIASEPRETPKSYRYESEALGVGKVLVYVAKDTSRLDSGNWRLDIGDTIVARTRIRRGGKVGDFDYGLYLRRQGIVGTAYVWKYDVRCTMYEGKEPLQRRLYRRLGDGGLSGDELATTGALTLGYKEDLDPVLRQRFQASGAAHVLAVSGLHTGIIYALLMGLLTLGGRVRPLYENRVGRTGLGAVVIAVMWGYAWLTGMTPSVVRCVVMVSVVEIGRMLYRRSMTLNTIAAAAVLILMVRPLDLWSLSFQLSFAATAAIVVLAKDLEKELHRLHWRRKFYGKLVSWLMGTVIISIAAQLGTMPITMYTFGQVSNYFLLTNLLVLPIATVLVPCGLLSIALGGSWIGIWVSKVTFVLAWLMNHAVGWIEGLPGSVSVIHIDGGMVALLYAAIGMGWLAMHKSLWWLVGVAVSAIAFCVWIS
ncbi:MAG: ComEC/Rec2 family competence protein [Paludibacteraceae bacterium]|nr:ComEC/Rec2 family competence protein [Paludibacteraceae bacterium]